MKAELSKLGVKTEVFENSVTVYPSALVSPSEPLCSHNDHRIAMALAVVLSTCDGTLLECECVNKSYPTFFKDLSGLGILLEEA